MIHIYRLSRRKVKILIKPDLISDLAAYVCYAYSLNLRLKFGSFIAFPTTVPEQDDGKMQELQ